MAVQRSKKYRRVYEQLTNFELQQDKLHNRLISDDDIMGDLAQKQRPHLFLDFYSEEGVRKALDHYGIFRDLEKRGFKDFIIKLDTKDPYRHKFRAYYEKQTPDHLLCEVYLRKKTFTAKPIFVSDVAGENFTLIVIEWLMLQDPTAQFAAHRQPLPGQKYPGLRIGRKVLDIFVNMCLRLKTDGLLNIPEHYHNAAFYSRSFNYFNPQTEGYYQAIRRDLSQYGIYHISWAIFWECLIEKNSGEYWKWFTDEQIMPVSEKIVVYFESAEYRKRVQETSDSVRFQIDDQKYRDQRDKHKMRDAAPMPEVN